MTLWRRLFRRTRPLVIDDFNNLLAATELAPQKMVELVGTVEALETIVDPLEGQECVAVDYDAWPPRINVIDGTQARRSRTFKISCHQAVDFVLHRAGKRLLIRVDRGRDIHRIHRDLLDRHGFGLHAEVEPILSGESVRIVGTLKRVRGQGSPHRSEPYIAEIAAQRIWRLAADA